MTISDPIDVDPRSPENREGALTSNPSPLPKYSPRAGADKPHKHDVAVPSKSPSPSKEPVSDDERFERPESKKDASEEPASHGAGPIQDEIVVAPLRGSRPRSDPEPGNGRPEAQVETKTPSKRQFSEREVSNNTVAMPTPMTQANRELKEETVTPAARRNPKRTASAMAQLQPASESRHEDILDATLKPLENEELGNWAGWIELESEPVRTFPCHGLGISIHPVRSSTNCCISGILQLHSERPRCRGCPDKGSSLPGRRPYPSAPVRPRSGDCGLTR